MRSSTYSANLPLIRVRPDRLEEIPFSPIGRIAYFDAGLCHAISNEIGQIKSSLCSSGGANVEQRGYQRGDDVTWIAKAR